MEKHNIQAVIFDLGNTLMYADKDWPPVIEQADRQLAESLCEQGVPIDCENFHIEFRLRLKAYYAQRDKDMFETTYHSVLSELLKEKGYSNIENQILRKSLDTLFAVTQRNWLLEEDAIPTLNTLKKNGYHLGIISNAGDNRDVLQLVDKFEIDSFFDFILTSAACSYRKPHKRIFELALNYWGFQPASIAMVGDSVDADIYGAQQMKMAGIWINRRCPPGSEKPHPAPSAIISTLSELPQALAHLETRSAK